MAKGRQDAKDENEIYENRRLGEKRSDPWLQETRRARGKSDEHETRTRFFVRLTPKFTVE